MRFSQAQLMVRILVLLGFKDRSKVDELIQVLKIEKMIGQGLSLNVSRFAPVKFIVQKCMLEICHSIGVA